jgi:hypothetical protein
MGGDANFITPVDEAEDALQEVIAIRTPSHHMQKEVELGWGEPGLHQG